MNYFTKDEIGQSTQYDVIVKVNYRELQRAGFYKFIEQYMNFGYGYLFHNQYLESLFKNEARVSVILPVVFNADIFRVPFNHYVNGFRTEYCKIESSCEYDLLSDMSLFERINVFSERKCFLL